MKPKSLRSVLWLASLLMLVSSACGTSAAPPTSTSTPDPTATATITLTPTNTPRPTVTPRPTRTPNLAATQQMEEVNGQTQGYFDLGYLSTTDGEVTHHEDSSEEWAQLDWYRPSTILTVARDFYVSAHFKWTSAYRNAGDSGCGFVFAANENGDHYAVFLDRAKIIFLDNVSSSSYSRSVGLTRGTGVVKFGNPFDEPVEADFTLIVEDAYARVLIDDEVVGEYTLSQSRALDGFIGLALLSGTNRDFGTRCEVTNMHTWVSQ
ncbi:MAG TPA: hypothetical protein VFQ23_18060 [Anaerolineales bacterium]|nr:hypothetical protein [Anaerolineales bacterium]